MGREKSLPSIGALRQGNRSANFIQYVLKDWNVQEIVAITFRHELPKDLLGLHFTISEVDPTF